LGLGSEEEKELNKEEYATYQRMLKRDEARFKAADQDKDGKLSKKGRRLAGSPPFGL